MRYRIGEVAEMFNIPKETIKFYEKKNIIKFKRDINNNYRYFDYRDINKILAYRMYRKLDFSLNESLIIVNSCDLSVLEKSIINQKAVLEKQQQELNDKITKLTLLKEKIKIYKNFDNDISIIEYQEMLFFPWQINEKFFIEKNNYFFHNLLSETIVAFQGFEAHMKDENKIIFGYAIPYKDNYPKEYYEYGVIQEKKQCLHMNIILKSNGNIFKEICEKLLKFDKFDNYKLTGEINGFILHEFKQKNNDIALLIEVYAPIQKNI
jgi:Predicted transcriptional regulators